MSALLADTNPELDVGAAAIHYPLTDAGNAELFAAMFKGLVLFDHMRRRWLVWDSHRWRPDDLASVRLMALQAVRARTTAAADFSNDLDADARKRLVGHGLRSEGKSRIDALLSLAESMPGIADGGRGWDTIGHLLGAPNGVVDLRSGELRDGRPEDRITMSAGIHYDPDAVCPRWDLFLREVLADGDDEDAFDAAESMASYVQRLIGYTAAAEQTLQLVVVTMGVGSNGKTTFLRTIKRALGDYATGLTATVLKAAKFEKHLTEVADLEFSRLATCEEVGDSKLNTDRLKTLSGGDEIRANRMRQDTRAIPQTWVLWLSTNGEPRTDDNSWAFWRRIKVLNFPRVFQPDEGLAAKLERELPGILAWIVRGAVAYYAEGLGDEPVAIATATQEYREDVDPLEALFEAGVLVVDSEARTPTSDLHAAYVTWASARGIAAQYGADGYAKLLAGRFTRAKVGPRDARVRGFKGVRVGVLPQTGMDEMELWALVQRQLPAGMAEGWSP